MQGVPTFQNISHAKIDDYFKDRNQGIIDDKRCFLL